MIVSSKYCILAVLITIGLLLVATVSAKPGTTSKIRIHVPVKHHTHTHTITKTIIKEVHVPVKKTTHHEKEDEHPPLKYQYAKRHRVSDDHENYDDDLSDEYQDLNQKPKPKKFYPQRHPFY